MKRWAFHIAAALLAAGILDAQQPRDNRSPVETGSAAITGVVADDHDGRPLRRARVTIGGSDLAASRTAITADDGTFSFESLPPGRYSLSAAKDAYVSMNFGASGPGRPGRVVVLAQGATHHALLRLPRGAIITGTVLTPEGEPAPETSVTALVSKYDPVRGERRYTAALSATTDDRGVYRIFGLPAGSYLVAALPRAARGLAAGLEVTTEADVRRALAEVQESRTSARPGMPVPVPLPLDAADTGGTVALTRIFYPGTAVQQRASAITLGAGEVRHDINIDLEYVATATVEGTVTVFAGTRVMVTIADADVSFIGQTTRMSVSVNEDGRFVFRRLPPGAYKITARTFPAGGRMTAATPQTAFWGETELTVAGEDMSGIALVLRPPLSISGTLAFDGSVRPPAFSGDLRLPFAVFSVTSSNAVTPVVQIDGSRFTIQNVPRGRYRLSSPPRGVRAPIGVWWLKSVLINRKELLDNEIEITESTDEAVITFSDRASELSGVARYADGTPIADGFVVAFSTDQRFWFHNSRRVAGVRLSARGEYVVRNLPPGDYGLVVTNDIAANEWFDPDALRALARGARVISLHENEVRAQELTVTARSR